MKDRARGPAVLRLLPEPGRPYGLLRDDLVGLGWAWTNESQTLPTVPGEPEWVAYAHPSGAVLEYEYLPPVGLRSIVASGGPDALAPLETLPHRDPGTLGDDLDQPEAERVLHGLFAVQAMVWLPLLGRVRRLAAEHPDRLVRQVAGAVAARLPELAASELERWQAVSASHPGRSTLLASMPVDDRRQVLRWMGRDRRSADQGVLDALRTGLADDDAEVRATAALVAARLGARELSPAVEQVVVPDELAAAVRLARTSLRSGALPPCEPEDEESLLVCALLDPVPDVPAPGRLPAHLSDDAGVRLRRSRVQVALVPAVPHWLWGEGDGRLHQVRVEAFVVTVAPVQVAVARLLGLPASGDDPDPYLTTEAAAEELARRLSTLEGVPVSVVDTRRWEAALRGPDGRRFTAGNVAPHVALSPWGALAVPGVRERLAGGMAADSTELGVLWAAAPEERLPVRLALRFPL